MFFVSVENPTTTRYTSVLLAGRSSTDLRSGCVAGTDRGGGREREEARGRRNQVGLQNGGRTDGQTDDHRRSTVLIYGREITEVQQARIK